MYYVTIMFNLYKAQELLQVEVYIVRGIVYQDMWQKITVSPRFEQVEIVVIEVMSPWV